VSTRPVSSSFVTLVVGFPYLSRKNKVPVNGSTPPKRYSLILVSGYPTETAFCTLYFQCRQNFVTCFWEELPEPSNSMKALGREKACNAMRYQAPYFPRLFHHSLSPCQSLLLATGPVSAIVMNSGSVDAERELQPVLNSCRSIANSELFYAPIQDQDYKAYQDLNL
jgi:hypothetical protein